ncbi:Uncharacterised protein [Cedecea neteri]|uniref:Uncharacterized protein n=1 Tax=Cedecea neteri TaxID=158822 RepID=A0A2X2T6A3_9ENTR|nr:Uncharacterised protein [Cedecea neteri]
MMPISAETNAIKGRIVFRTVSIVSRPALEQHGDGGAHSHAHFCQQAVALFGNFFAGVVVACRAFSGPTCGSPWAQVMFSSLTPET